MLLVLILSVAKASEVYLIGRIDHAVSRYNLKRIQKTGRDAGTGLYCRLRIIRQLVHGSGIPRLDLADAGVCAPEADPSFIGGSTSWSEPHIELATA